MHIEGNNEGLSRKYCSFVQTLSINNSECVFVALVVQQAVSMSCILLSLVVSPAVPYFLHYITKGKVFVKKLIDKNSVFYFLFEFC